MNKAAIAVLSSVCLAFMGVITTAAAAPHPFETADLKKKYKKKAKITQRRFNIGPKPKRWCGWWMRTQFGGGPEYNLARNWAKRGRKSGPRVGVIVVWRGHVGIITGKARDGRWIVKSGNDGNKVRERPRSLKHRTGNPIAFRAL